jgi:hypothetical protein
MASFLTPLGESGEEAAAWFAFLRRLPVQRGACSPPLDVGGPWLVLA